jgi:hypothetical protein
LVVSSNARFAVGSAEPPGLGTGVPGVVKVCLQSYTVTNGAAEST